MAELSDIRLRCFLQVLENQEHILYFIDQMNRSGNVSHGMYYRDTIGDDLVKDTQKLKKEIQNWGD